MLAYSRSTATVTERSSGTRYSRKTVEGRHPANLIPSVSNSQTEEARLPNVVRPPKKNSLSQSPKKEGPAMITIKFNGKPTQIPTSTPITTFLTTHNYNPIHVVVELNEVIIPKDSYPTTTLSPDDTLEILTFMGGGQ